MPSYVYIGRNSNGEEVTGVMQSTDAMGVADQLTKQRVIPVTIEQEIVNQQGAFGKDMTLSRLLGFDKVELDDLIVFCRQMYALVKSGVPILRAIHGMAESSTSQTFAKVLDDIGLQLEGGYTLSTAMHQHPHIFTPLFVSLIHVGENTGKLDESFIKLAGYFEREQATRKRIKTAMRYPTFVLVAIFAALIILNIFVIPTFASMFEKLGAELPLATKMLIASSNFFVEYWPHVLLSMVLIVVAIKQYLKTPKGRYFWDKRKLTLPIVGGVIERSILSRFAHSFSIVLRAGVPMTSGISLVADAVDNTYMQDKLITMRSSIESGESLLRSANNTRLFTPLVIQMVAIGEETGRVDELLEEVGEYYEREVDYDLSTLTAKIEPIMIGIVAAMVLVLALGIFTPMWDMLSAFQGKK